MGDGAGGREGWNWVDPYPSNAASTPVGATSATELRSIQQARLLFAVSEGEIEGVLHPNAGLKDIYLNDVPIQNPDGSFNFNGISVALVGGTTTQNPIPGFTEVETLHSGGSEITTSSPQSVSVTDPSANAVRLTVSMPTFKEVSSGNTTGSSVQLKFEVSTDGGGYVDVTDTVDGFAAADGSTVQRGQIVGQSDGPYAKSFRVRLPSGSAWIVRVSRETKDAAGYTFNHTYLQSYSIITEQQLRYPAVSLLALSLDASRFSSLPKVSIAAKGIKCKVPANYTPASYRAHTLGSKIEVTGTPTLAWDASTRTIHRSAGSFIDDGFEAGQTCLVSGFSNAGNNGSFKITEVTDSDLTFGNAASALDVSGSSTVLSWNPKRIDCLSLDFPALGVIAGQNITLSGFPTAANNGTFRIAGVQTHSLVFDRNFTVETAAATVTFAAAGITTESGATGRNVLASGAPAVAIDASSKTLTRKHGSNILDGFAEGQVVELSGFDAAGNNGSFEITDLSATVMTFGDATGLVDEDYATGRQVQTGWVAATYATSGTGTSLGAWDGSFKTAYTSNPAWIFFDLATNKRYGAGRYLSESAIDTAELYKIAQVCDALVSDGMGGLEPRFVYNGYLTNRDEAFKVLAHVLSAARANPYYAGGKLVPVQDVDGTPVALFTPSNVKQGKFEYTGSARKARHTQANVTWMDPTQLYAAVPELVLADDASIARYGIQVTSFIAVGATSRGQARRAGRYVLLTEQKCTETVSFTTGMDGIVARPGNICLIQDPGKARARLGGRIKSATSTSATLDSEVVLLDGQTYTIYLQLPDGSLVNRTITDEAGSYTVLNWSSELTTLPQVEAQWLLSSSAQAATRWRILSIKETQDSTTKEYAITAIQQDPSIYAQIDTTDPLVTRTNTGASFQPVADLAVGYVTEQAQGNVIHKIAASWTAQTTATGYRAEIQLNSGPWRSMDVNGAGAAYESMSYGSYQIRVFAIYPGGVSKGAYISLSIDPVTVTVPSVSGGYLLMADKPTAIASFDSLTAQVTALRSQCTALGGTLPAANTLQTYLESLSPSWTDLGVDTVVPDATPWTLAWGSMFTEIASLQTIIADLLNAATGGELERLRGYSSDGILSVGEKSRLIADYATATATWETLSAGAQAAGLNYDDLAAAWLALSACVAGLSPALDDLTQPTNISGIDLYGLWSAFDIAALELQIKLQATAGSVTAIALENTDLSGTGTPAADGYDLLDGDSVMLSAQTDPAENGIYGVAITTTSGSATTENGSATTSLPPAGGSYTNDANSRDGNDATSATLASSASGTSSAVYGGFTGSGTSGDIRVRLTPTLVTDTADDYSAYINAGMNGVPYFTTVSVAGSCAVYYSLNGGSTWTLADSWSGTSPGVQDFTIAFAGVPQSLIRVRIDATAQKRQYGYINEDGLPRWAYIYGTASLAIADVSIESTGSTAGYLLTKSATVRNGQSFQVVEGTTWSGRTVKVTVASDNAYTLSGGGSYVPNFGTPSEANMVPTSDLDGKWKWTKIAEIGNNYTYWDPNFPPSSPSALDDEFVGGPSLDAKWTRINSGTVATSLDVNSSVPGKLGAKGNLAAGSALEAILQPLPDGDFTVFAEICLNNLLGGNAMGGIIISTTKVAGTGSQWIMGLALYSGGSIAQYIPYTNFSSAGSSGNWPQIIKYLRFRRVGSTYYYSLSTDGFTWVENTFAPGFTPAYIGLFVRNVPAVQTSWSFNFFRYVANGASTNIPGALVSV